ncbi:hypothetical protein ACVWZB_004817 [Paenibacillus polymyxa]
MKDNRKNIKAASQVKAGLRDILQEFGDQKTESFVLAYLISMYKDQKSKRITLTDHQTYWSQAEKMNISDEKGD